MVLKAGISDPALLGIPESILPDLRQQADLFSREDLLRLFDAFQKIEAGMRYASQLRFHLEMGLIELSHISRLRPIEDLIAEFSAAEGTSSPRNPGSLLSPRACRARDFECKPGRSQSGSKAPYCPGKRKIRGA